MALEEAWDDLWRRDPNATPFQSPHWLLPWWKHFGSGELCILANGDNGRLTSLAPLFIVRDDDQSLGMLLGTGISDYLDVLGSVDEVMGHLDAADCQMWDLQQLRPTSKLLALNADGWHDNVEEQEPCPVLEIGGAGEELQNILSTHARKKLRYYARRIGPATFEEPTADSLDDFMTALFDLHASRWSARGLPGVLADDVIQSFHREVARKMFAAGSLRMYAMRVEDRIVAIFYGFAHHDTVYYYLSGYEASLEKFSAGHVIVAHAVQQAVREGAHTFDFLRGAEEYKYAWGAQDRINRRRQLARG